MRTLGMLGGMSYSATSLYYNSINATIQRTLGGATSAPLLLHSFNHAEMSTLFTTQNWGAVAAKFVGAARHMKDGGAEGLVICCNVGHRVAQEVERESGLEVLHIADPTGKRICEELEGRGKKRVALLGTRPVMEDAFLRERLEQRYGLDIVVPDVRRREELQRIIFKELGAGVFREESRRALVDMIRDAVSGEGAVGVVFACTELQFLVKRENVGVPVWDTLENHAAGAAKWILEG
jgi:aspartate racemase